MSILGEIETATVSKAFTPWLVAAAVMALVATGTSGMYFGTLIERGRNAKEVAALKDEQLRSITYATDLWKQAQERSDEVSGKFETMLKNIKVENKTFVNQVQHEVQREVYIDCKVPDTGIDLLTQQVNQANTHIVAGRPPATQEKAKQ